MILPMLLAGAGCVALAAWDAWRHPGNPFAVMRTSIALLWAVGLLAYGLNPLEFPQPELKTILLVLPACAIGIASVPAPGRWRGLRDELAPLSRPALTYFYVLTGIAAAVVLWDVAHVVMKAQVMTLSVSLMDHRIDRTFQSGAYAIPGTEVLHAIGAATGVIGYALWLRERRKIGLVAAVLGLVNMLMSTGRWDVVSYGLWCFSLEPVLRRDLSPRRLQVSQAITLMLLAIFFVAHGRLLNKIEGLDQATVNPAAATVQMNAAMNLGSRPGLTRPRSPNRPIQRCERWEKGAKVSNEALRSFSSVSKVMLTYFAGPYAALDRALCESRPADRVVLFYWPLKVAAFLGLTGPFETLIVDPFIDIGVPFNNYTVMYPFYGELGGIAAGLIGWLVTAFVVRLLILHGLSGRFGLGGLVAGAAPVAIAIRAPWANAFFDGSLVVYVGVALGVWWLTARSIRRP